MNDGKPWYTSKTIWSGLVAAVVGLLGLFGFTVPEGEVQTLTEMLVNLVATGAGLVAMYGRIVATSKIGGS